MWYLIKATWFYVSVVYEIIILNIKADPFDGIYISISSIKVKGEKVESTQILEMREEWK